MGEVVLSLWAFIIYTIICISFGFVVLGLLKTGSDADDSIMNHYWVRMAFMARSIMTEDQLAKLDKMMEEKDEE